MSKIIIYISKAKKKTLDDNSDQINPNHNHGYDELFFFVFYKNVKVLGLRVLSQSQINLLLAYCGHFQQKFRCLGPSEAAILNSPMDAQSKIQAKLDVAQGQG